MSTKLMKPMNHFFSHLFKFQLSRRMTENFAKTTKQEVSFVAL